MLSECLLSIIEQSFTDYEVIVGNDFTGHKLQLIDFGCNDSRLRIVNHSENLGEINNMNWLLDQASGEYFIWMADDDLMHPECLAQMALALSRPGRDRPSAVYTAYNSGPLRPEFDVITDIFEYAQYSLTQFMVAYLSKKIDIIGCYGAMKTDYLRGVGGIRSLGSGFGPYSDTILPLLLAEKGVISYVPQKLVYLRTHSGSLSCKSSDLQAYLTAEDEFIEIFHQICFRNNIMDERGGLFCMLIRWFAGNENAVVMRSALRRDVRVWFSVLKRHFLLSTKGSVSNCAISHFLYWARVIVHDVISYSYEKDRVTAAALSLGGSAK